MLGQKILPVILLLLPATSALTVHTTVVEAASNQCKAKPDSVAPAGSRWYYRANRLDRSRCWFLSSRNVSVHSHLSQTAPVTRSHTPNTVKCRSHNKTARSAPRQPQQLNLQKIDWLPGRRWFRRWPQTRRVRTNCSRARSRRFPTELSVASTQPPSDALVQAKPSGAQASAGIANFNLVFLGAVVATSLSLAGGVFHLTRRVRSRDYALADRPNADRRIITYPPEPVVHSLEEAKQQLYSIGQPTGWQPTGRQTTRRQATGLTADDLNRSVRELRRNLERAGFARVA